MLRADAVATLYFFHPLRKLFPPSRSGVPILMYHSVSDSPDTARHPYFQTVTTPMVFAQHMQFLRENGFTSVSLSEAVEHLKTPSPALAKPVVITFDDGYRDFLTNAFPVLQKNGFSATMFLPTGLIGDSTRVFKGFECLTWSEVRDLNREGVQFGSHTVTHPQLRSLDWKSVDFEVRASKEMIEERLGHRISSFAYPYAFPESDRSFTERLSELLNAIGYRNGVTTIIGTSFGFHSRLFLRRLPANSADHPTLFRSKLGGAYDWVRRAQYASKVLRENWSGALRQPAVKGS